jgi:hypothetical protein
MGKFQNEEVFHMKKIFVARLLLAAAIAIPLAAQMPDGFLDVYVAKVKLGKRAEFDAINKREVEINRKNKGDTWLAYSILYGEQNNIYFVSTRTNWSAAEEGLKAFEGSLTKGLGAAGAHKLSDAFDATVDSERSEFRRRRLDLSASVPADSAAYFKLIGEARYIRTVVVHVRSGRMLDYEAQLKLNKEAQERANPGIPTLISQGVAGQAVGVYYISTLVKNLADFDRIKTLQEVLGSSYSRYQKALAEMVSSTEIMIGRFLPEISNPPEEIVAVDSKFWRPTPLSAAVAKPAE